MAARGKARRRCDAPCGTDTMEGSSKEDEAEVAEPADAAVLNTAGSDPVRVRTSPSAPAVRDSPAGRQWRRPNRPRFSFGAGVSTAVAGSLPKTMAARARSFSAGIDLGALRTTGTPSLTALR